MPRSPSRNLYFSFLAAKQAIDVVGNIRQNVGHPDMMKFMNAKYLGKASFQKGFLHFQLTSLICIIQSPEELHQLPIPSPNDADLAGVEEHHLTLVAVMCIPTCQQQE